MDVADHRADVTGGVAFAGFALPHLEGGDVFLFLGGGREGGREGISHIGLVCGGDNAKTLFFLAEGK